MDTAWNGETDFLLKFAHTATSAVYAPPANQERQRLEGSEVSQLGQVSAARQVAGEKQANQVSEIAKQAALQPVGGYVDLNLTREGGTRMVFAKG
jgi:hypothetical protein